MINFIVQRKPHSYNSTDKQKKKAYMNEIVSCYQRRYKSKIMPYLSGKLYGLVYYFFQENLYLDADNLSKPIWDSLNGVVYTDDSQIITRSITAINIKESDITLIDFTGIDGSILADIIDSIYSKEHTLYIECGVVNNNIWKFNLEDL